MKKTLVMLIAALTLIACSKIESSIETDTNADSPVSFKVSVNTPDDTKALKSAWANGDKIYVFFEGLATKYLLLTYNSSTDEWEESQPGGTINSSEFVSLNKELTAVHIPVAANVSYADSKFSFRDANNDPIYTFYLKQENKTYSFDGSTVTVGLSLAKPAKYVWFHVAGIQDNYSQYYMYLSNNSKSTACDYVALTGGVTEKETEGHVLVPVADSDGAIYATKGITFGAGIIMPIALIKVNSASDMIATRTYQYNAGPRPFASGTQYNLPGLAKWTENKYVNLGFASFNVNWATGNLTDATEEEVAGPLNGSIVEFNEYGKYYAWADVTGYSPTKYVHSFDLTTVPYYDSGTSAYTKYDNVKLILEKGGAGEANDDAARYRLGSPWRMPIIDEVENLYNAGEWVTTPANGWKVSGPNGLCLFLPAAGRGVEKARWSKGSEGYYWSSVIRANSGYVYARRLQFTASANNINEGLREQGFSIRPVRDL